MLHRWFWLFFWLGFPARGVEYFVSPSGNDAAPGQSPATAWRTIERVNRHLAESGPPGGDQIRFRGGGRFAGNLVIARSPRGTRSQPTVLASYGRGPATILAGEGTGVLVRESPWVCLTNLVILAGRSNNGDGIRFDRIQRTPERMEGVRIEHCVTRGFAWHGIMVDSAQQERGFAEVVIADCEAAENRHAGIMIYGGNPAGRTHHAHAEVQILRCRAWLNAGDPDLVAHHSGSGILVDGVERGRVAECSAWRNGGECRSERGGPVGIWAHASQEVVIEGCESFENRTLLRDGGGFDLDGGCERCVLQGNFSHDNDGPGFLMYTYIGAAYADRGCRIIGNISWQDGRRGSGYAGLQIAAENGCRLQDLAVVSNTIVVPRGSVAAVKIQGFHVEARLEANLILASEHTALLSVSGFDHRLRFVRNQYWRIDGRPVFLVDFSWPVESMAGWMGMAARDNRFSEVAEEVFGDPGFRAKVVRGEPVRGPRWLDFRLDPAVAAGARTYR